MSFMQPTITDELLWAEIETDNGTWYVPAEDFHCLDDVNAGEILYGDLIEVLDKCAFLACTEGLTLKAVTVIAGYGARFSAPGYMDCTEFTVHDTEAEAAKCLLEQAYDGDPEYMEQDAREEVDELEGLAGIPEAERTFLWDEEDEEWVCREGPTVQVRNAPHAE